MSDFHERRATQRLQLAEPIPANVNGAESRLLDIGVSGALIEHGGSLETGSEVSLSFQHGEELIEFRCEVVRSTSPQPLPSGVLLFPSVEGPPRKFQSGVHFLEPVGNAEESLRRMLGDHVNKILRAQQANAMGDRDQNVIDGDATITSLGAAKRSSASGFFQYRLGPKGWKKTFALLPDQPPDGFTVFAYEDEEHLEGLCRGYEEADEQGRRLIRMMAELSIQEVTGTSSKVAPKTE